MTLKANFIPPTQIPGKIRVAISHDLDYLCVCTHIVHLIVAVANITGDWLTSKQVQNWQMHALLVLIAKLSNRYV